MENSIFLAAKDGKVEDIIHFISESQNPNATGCGGYTPVHIATVFNHPEALKTLLLNGGNPDQETEDGKTALRIAEEKGHGEIIEMLKSEEWKKERVDYVRFCENYDMLSRGTCLQMQF